MVNRYLYIFENLINLLCTMQVAQDVEATIHTALGETPYLKCSFGGFPREGLDAMIALSASISGWKK